MKKFFPIYLLFITLSVVTVGQMMFNWLDLKAGSTNVEKKVFSHYESLYSQLELSDISGEKIKLKELKSPIVILNFWATWCQPCLEEFPSIVALRNKYTEDQVRVLGINQDDEKQIINIKKAVKKFNLNFSNIADVNGSILEKFMISAIPVSIIYHNGKVIEVSNGAKDYSSEEVIEKFNSLLKL
ncbi:TlpA disulfide reductase family protein [Halobacteriovorax sp. HLS]|uniref:TlpA family protein disulfide reductase n=1 Tax=Halobacteriovorax sp. HLS TaxID=2234000 RepID=UPI000FD88C2E|nr:TlpA disulfide reductase family protein [Halobacteriovorax sp. HLS]